MNSLWYSQHPFWIVLWPFAVIFRLLSCARRFYLEQFKQKKYTTPIIVVGNISVGGVGKTPIVIALVQQLKSKGIRVGIVSRGYGSQKLTQPYSVTPQDDAFFVGDEPLLIAKKTDCPVVIFPDRCAAVEFLQKNYQPQIIISDDGLQHYKMGRAIEIAVIDGVRGLGNGLCLPAGPLREGASRLNEVDFIVINSAKGGLYSLDNKVLNPKTSLMHLKPMTINQLSSHKSVTKNCLAGNIAAVAGIGNPQRFFVTLNQIGLKHVPYIFPDHYRYQAKDLVFNESTVIMTEKDAVKCQKFAHEKMYYLSVEAILENGFLEALWSHEKLQNII